MSCAVSRAVVIIGFPVFFVNWTTKTIVLSNDQKIDQFVSSVSEGKDCALDLMLSRKLIRYPLLKPKFQKAVESAVCHGCPTAIESFLSAGADPNEFVKSMRHRRLLYSLLPSSSSPKETKKTIPLSVSAIELAMAHNQAAVLIQLLVAGATTHEKHFNGCNALTYAAKYVPQFIPVLLQHGVRMATLCELHDQRLSGVQAEAILQHATVAQARQDTIIAVLRQGRSIPKVLTHLIMEIEGSKIDRCPDATCKKPARTPVALASKWQQLYYAA